MLGKLLMFWTQKNHPKVVFAPTMLCREGSAFTVQFLVKSITDKARSAQVQSPSHTVEAVKAILTGCPIDPLFLRTDDREGSAKEDYSEDLKRSLNWLPGPIVKLVVIGPRTVLASNGKNLVSVNDRPERDKDTSTNPNQATQQDRCLKFWQFFTARENSARNLAIPMT